MACLSWLANTRQSPLFKANALTRQALVAGDSIPCARRQALSFDAQRQKRVRRIAAPAHRWRGSVANNQLCGRGGRKVDAPAAGFGSGRGGWDARPRGRGLFSLRPMAQHPAVFPAGRQAGARRPGNNEQESGGTRRGAQAPSAPHGVLGSAGNSRAGSR